MKKLGVAILLLFSLQLFGEGYEVKKSKKVTLSEQQINQENREIEAGVKNVVKETYKVLLSSVSNEIESSFQAEIDTEKMTKKEKEELKKVSKIMAESYSKLFALVAETTEIKVKKIEYLSNSKVNVKYETKIINIDEVDINDKDEKEIEKRFLKRYGRKLPKNDNIEDVSKMMNIYMEILKEKFDNAKKAKKYEIDNEEMELEKIKGKWTSKELEETLRELDKVMKKK
ncbi:hypothetical protein [Leptotrichia sp. oral taxon 212]|uniref:hypothetical protein n=1 Tax=Leptotrichia sp. oral taxon 212 TaxID=712357 RepID=UPI0006A9BA18|nr:hypothetical protein [Leptotrichia sp. oral taxon 212]ALA95112.1 hypothetical protein AMK43_02815 [Leptotrichia sp. oral taxon 212]